MPMPRAALVAPLAQAGGGRLASWLAGVRRPIPPKEAPNEAPASDRANSAKAVRSLAPVLVVLRLLDIIC